MQMVKKNMGEDISVYNFFASAVSSLEVEIIYDTI